MTDLSKYKAWEGKERVSATGWNAIIDAIRDLLGNVNVGDIRIHIGITGTGNPRVYPSPAEHPTIYPVRLYCGHWRPTQGTDYAPLSWNCTLDPQPGQPVIVYAAIIGNARGRFLPYDSPVVVFEICGQYWCLPVEPLIYHFTLADCLFPGGSAPAYLLINGREEPGQITVYDRLGVFIGSEGDKGTCFWDYASNTYSIIYIDGRPCSESSISEPSISEPSISQSSVSESSISESSVSESSISESSVSESSFSQSISSESSASESSAPPSESWPSESSKSTAIVPVSFTSTGYAALFIHEMPEVRFDDIIIANVQLRDTQVRIDPRFVEVCQAGTIEVCGVSCDTPVQIGAVVEGDAVKLRFAPKSARKRARVVIRLTGIRKGFAGQRFPPRTRKQFEQNERFINSAYDAE